ncbi:MAG: PspC domain-containing protein [Phycisphaerales bacterium]|jgi:phage shock protein PspC (stress-responsive transcriptional regulator)|nr:PspC domain-containing protein [Phycisphaerales bacterium]MDP6312309.1 PspC domain-containing protein [Phycisphaerales bacterium]MDP7086019.1 PspC domain-containing protein [Phycisphaerales bacterium]MDP7189005.1 PspC domain-containing protein [Phycisphaerales bacterium]MDP7519879.1 PspC domain-containing protein [Phycisphaerales bacterium]|tara:strand:+ start:1459 stop:1638 length:180 start_codon:yes stop_codon:yes gene_type:complete
MPLVRHANNRVIAGVCGGIADFLGWDPTLVRILWLVLVLVAGTGLLAYLILWICMPLVP